MKKLVYPALFAIIGLTLMAQTPSTNAPAPAPAAPAKMPTTIFDWDQMHVETKPNGERRDVFDAPTTTLDKVHCHITTLKPGENSGAPRLHLQEEIIIVKEGTVEATFDGQTKIVGPGSVIFFAANATTRLRNAGDSPCTYTVINYYPSKN